MKNWDLRILEIISSISNRISRKFDFWIISIVGIVNAFCLTPSITNSLGITSLEDGPIQPALVFDNPSAFTNDFRASEFQRLMWTTSTKWLPAILYKYLSIDPVFFHVFMTYLQTVLLLVGTFYLALALTDSRLVSYISTCFVIMFSPYFNNFSSYGDQFFMPYATWVSIGPLLIAWACALTRKQGYSFFWLIVGASIHPAMALCASFAIVATSIKSIQPIKSILIHSLKLLSPAFFFSLISAMVSFMATAETVPEDWYEGTRKVLHWYAWKLNPADEVTFETSTYSIILALTSLSIANSRSLDLTFELRRRIRVITGLFFLMYILQAISYQLNIRILFSISFGRFSIFSAIFIVIIFATLISHQFRELRNRQERAKSAVIISCILLPSFINLAFLTMLFFLIDFRSKIRNRALSSLNLLFASVFIFFARANYNNEWFKGEVLNFVPNGIRNVPNYLPLRMLEHVSFYFWGLIVLLILLYLLQTKIAVRALTVGTIIISMSLLSLVGRYILSERRDQTHADWIATQKWAQMNTQQDSKFIVNSGFDIYESWTTLSKRPRIVADQSAGFLYFYTKEDFIYDKKRAHLPSAPDPKTSDTEEIELFYLNFREVLGGDYLVWKTNDVNLSFRVVFQNTAFTIYKLNN